MTHSRSLGFVSGSREPVAWVALARSFGIKQRGASAPRPKPAADALCLGGRERAAALLHALFGLVRSLSRFNQTYVFILF